MGEFSKRNSEIRVLQEGPSHPIPTENVWTLFRLFVERSYYEQITIVEHGAIPTTASILGIDAHRLEDAVNDWSAIVEVPRWYTLFHLWQGALIGVVEEGMSLDDLCSRLFGEPLSMVWREYHDSKMSR